METKTELSLEQKVLAIARDRGTIGEDYPTALQHFGVLVEHFSQAKKYGTDHCANPTSGNEILLTKAIGQCLFDLIVQANKQGWLLGDCIPKRNLFAVVAPVWPMVDSHLEILRTALETRSTGHEGIVYAIAQVHACLCAGSQSYLRRDPESCLDLTLENQP